MTKCELRHYAKENGLTLSDAREQLRKDATKARGIPSPRPYTDDNVEIDRERVKTDDTVALLIVSPKGTMRMDATQERIDCVTNEYKRHCGGFTASEAAAAMGDGFQDGAHLRDVDGNKLGQLILMYVGMTESWKMARMMGSTGMVITVIPLIPGGGYVRPGDMICQYDHIEELNKEIAADYNKFPAVIDMLLNSTAQEARSEGSMPYSFTL